MNIKCDFCGEKLTQFELVKHPGGKRWRFHLWCSQTLETLRKRQRSVPCKDISLALNYIILYINRKSVYIHL